MITMSPSRGVGSRRRADIDGLRGIAVVAVVVFHFAPDVLPGGLLGVDVFFVISGYVITNLLLSQQTSSFADLRRFWGNRIRRLFPALIVVLAAVMTAGYFWLYSPQYVELAESGAWASFMASNIFFFQQTGYFEPAADTVPLLNLWSLGVEEQFYLAWPLLMAAIMRFSKRLKFTVVVSLGLGSWLAALVVVGLANDQETALASVFYLPHFRAWEL
jgi:peptidoglycan/LPS O-acetylase OafA/YrhL